MGPCSLGSAASLSGLPGEGQVRGHPSRDTVAADHGLGWVGSCFLWAEL